MVEKTAGGYTKVQCDKQWIRRCKLEEINLIDSFAGPKADRIKGTISSQNAQHFYPSGARMMIKSDKEMQRINKKSYEDQSDDLDNVSRVSVLTPKTHVSSQSRKSGASGTVRPGDSVSYVSAGTNTTSASTKQKLL